jgi:GntR family transcriptional regulator / MocR family aminotransferase
VVSDARELLVRLDRDAGEPLAKQLGDALRDAVRSGRLPPGTRLPATRTLAGDLAVSRGVVVEAYEQLVAEGYLVGRAGGGTWVAAGGGPPAEPAGHRVRRPWHRDGPVAVVDARPGAPDLGLFPRSGWEAGVRQALRVPADLGYSAPWGTAALRREVAGYLGRVRGAVVAADSVVVTTGATQALALLTRTLARRGHRRLVVEDPSNAVQRGLLAGHGLEVLDVPVDDEGIDVAALARTGTRAVLVTPAHQYPTGVLMSGARRAALLSWARDTDGVVIEDDYDAEFRYDGRTTMCLQGDDPMRVALVGSVSKTLAPGLRLGWVVPPMGLVRAVAEVKRDADFGSDTITQLAFADLLASGRYDKHLRAARMRYSHRRGLLVAELARLLPDWTVGGLPAGQHLSVELAAGLDEATVADRARRRGLLVLEMRTMRTRPGPPALVVGFARLGGSMPRHVVEVLAAAAADARRDPGRPVAADPPTSWVPSGPASTVNAEDFYPPPTD